jgi:lactate permease
MQVWNQVYAPLGSLGLSALAAAVPIIFFFLALAVLRMKGHVAGAITLALALIVAIFAYGMPVPQALASAGYGFAYGLWPIAWIIISAVFRTPGVARPGPRGVIRASTRPITSAPRLLMLLIGLSFGACLVGAAGCGAPVAITAALLVGLGFNPLYAAGMCLIANTAPVAVGAMGSPIIVAGQVTGIDAMHIGAMAGRQLPLLSLFVPFWLVFMMDGLRGVKEVWPGALVAGGSFAVTQYFTSNFIGPELPDITSALVSLVSLTLLLKVWQPATAKNAASGVVLAGNAAGGAAALSGFGGVPAGGGKVAGRTRSPYTLAQTVRAWAPFGILTAIVTVWSLPVFKALFAKGPLAWTVLKVHVPFLDQMVIKTVPIVTVPKAYEALYKLDILSAVGTPILFTAIISMFLLGMKPADGLRAFRDTAVELRRPVLSIGLVLAFAFVANYSGMSSTLAQRDAAALRRLYGRAGADQGHVAENRVGAEDAVVAPQLDGADVGVAEREIRLPHIDFAVLRDGAVGRGRMVDADMGLDVVVALARRGGGDQAVGQQAVADRGAAILAGAAQRPAGQRQAGQRITRARHMRVVGVDDAAHVDVPVAGLDIDSVRRGRRTQDHRTSKQYLPHHSLLVF